MIGTIKRMIRVQMLVGWTGWMAFVKADVHREDEERHRERFLAALGEADQALLETRGRMFERGNKLFFCFIAFKSLRGYRHKPNLDFLSP